MPESAGRELRAYPLDYMDRGCLVAMSKEHGCSNAPTWELRVSGSVEPDACRQALRDLLCVYPICRSTVRCLDEKRPNTTDLHYVVHEEYDLDALFTAIDLRGEDPQKLEALRQQVRDRQLDPFERFPFHLTLARVADHEYRLLFQQHHAIADARGFIALLRDFADFLDCAQRGTRPDPARLEPYPKRGELEALELSRGRRFWWGLQGFWIWLRVTLHSLPRPIRRSYQNLSKDYTGGNATHYLTLDTKVLEEWRPLRARHGVSLTALLAGAYMLANRRWNEELGVPPGRTRISLIAETRPRDPGFRSFANHLGGLLAEAQLDREPEPLALMKSLHEQIVRQVRSDEHKKRLVFERVLVRKVSLDVMRKVVFEANATVNLNFSNVVAIDLPTLEGRDFRGEEMWITTPTMPPFAVLLTAVPYNGQLRFNFNYKQSIVTHEQIERLAQIFEAALGEIREVLAAS